MQLTGGPKVTHLMLSRKGDKLLANCSDRVARVLEISPASSKQLQPFTTSESGTRVRPQKVWPHSLSRALSS